MILKLAEIPVEKTIPTHIVPNVEVKDYLS